MKVAFSILSQPDGTWHWVMRLWEGGPSVLCTIYSAKVTSKTYAEACAEAWQKYQSRKNGK